MIMYCISKFLESSKKFYIGGLDILWSKNARKKILDRVVKSGSNKMNKKLNVRLIANIQLLKFIFKRIWRRKLKSSGRGVFRTQANIFDWVFIAK